MALATSSSLHPLNRASGSATYTSSSSALNILAAVNAPVEIPRRSEEIPTSLLINVNARPHDGVGMVRERHLEELIRRTLRAVVDVGEYPRCGMEVTLQILRAEGGETGGEGYLGLLAGLLNASVLAVMDAGVAMKEVCVAVLVGVKRNGAVVVEPPVRERGLGAKGGCKSLHVFCFGGKGKILLCESEGRFGMGEWEGSERAARKVAIDGEGSLVQGLREKVGERVSVDQRWRGG